jgi:hypothetical protein
MMGKFFDAYERPARLYPALICLSPIVAVAIGVHGAALGINSALVTLVTSFGGLFLFMSIARDLGKRLESSLYASWGGRPTTQLLRHRDMTLDRITKARYHEFLERHLNAAFPTPEEEAADPVAADDIYQSGTQWLLGKTRDKAKYPFVFRENVNYGFRRNCLGLKPIGILFGLSAMLWTMMATGALSSTGISSAAAVAASVGAKVAFLVALVIVLIWIFLITPNSVRRVAFAYGDMLLRACDTLPKRQQQAKVQQATG